MVDVKRVQTLLKRHGESVTRNVRTIGSRDSVTGQATISYGANTYIQAYLSSPLTRRFEAEAGIVIEEVRELFTQESVAFGDKITSATCGVFEIDEDPIKLLLHGRIVVYRAKIVKKVL